MITCTEPNLIQLRSGNKNHTSTRNLEDIADIKKLPHTFILRFLES